MGTTVKQPTLSEANRWFTEKVLPTRTAYAGFSPNRLWKSPMALVRGNADDPNGLCGDAASYVYDRFWDDFNDSRTSDGYQLGLVLWTGTVFNHIADVMLVGGRTANQTYRWNDATGAPVSVSGDGQYGAAQLLGLTVYDLYYKEKPQPLKHWWAARDSDMGGTIKLALMQSIGD